MQHCPWCGRAVQRIEKRYRCWHCFTTSKGYSDFERFNKERMIVAREVRGLTVAELAQMTDGDVADIVRWEEGSPFIDANTIARLADALDFPVAFFHQEAIEPLGETTLDWHCQVAWCECGGVLGDVGDTDRARCEKYEHAANSSAAGRPDRRHHENRTSGLPQSELGRAATGATCGVDGRTDPAFQGQPQADWESPRTVTRRKSNHAHRLKALGNGVYVPLWEEIFGSIAQIEMGMK